MEKLKRCPFCGEKSHIVDISGGYAIVCESKNCLGQMRITYGACDNREIFKRKLISDWNNRNPEVRAIVSAVECITAYRDILYEEMQEPYDNHGQCCIDVLDEALNRLRCFTTSAAVDAWYDG